MKTETVSTEGQATRQVALVAIPRHRSCAGVCPPGAGRAGARRTPRRGRERRMSTRRGHAPPCPARQRRRCPRLRLPRPQGADSQPAAAVSARRWEEEAVVVAAWADRLGPGPARPVCELGRRFPPAPPTHPGRADHRRGAGAAPRQPPPDPSRRLELIGVRVVGWLDSRADCRSDPPLYLYAYALQGQKPVTPCRCPSIRCAGGWRNPGYCRLR